MITTLITKERQKKQQLQIDIKKNLSNISIKQQRNNALDNTGKIVVVCRFVGGFGF